MAGHGPRTGLSFAQRAQIWTWLARTGPSSSLGHSASHDGSIFLGCSWDLAANVLPKTSSQTKTLTWCVWPSISKWKHGITSPDKESLILSLQKALRRKCEIGARPYPNPSYNHFCYLVNSCLVSSFRPLYGQFVLHFLFPYTSGVSRVYTMACFLLNHL